MSEQAITLIGDGVALRAPAPAVAAEPSAADAADFVALMKPRVMSLVVFTAFVGMMVAPGHLHPVLGFASLLCIAVGAGAAGARCTILRMSNETT